MNDYEPSYIGEIESVEDLINAIESTLQYWLDIHTKASAWAFAWVVDEDIQYTFKSSNGVLENNYFFFDWKEAANKRLGNYYYGQMQECSHCGMIYDNGYEDDQCCDKPRYRTARKSSIVYFFEDIGIDNYPEEVLRESLEKDGFPVYKRALEDIIAGPVEDIRLALKSIRKAKSKEDRLYAALSASHISHVHGNVLEDYSNNIGIDSDIIKQVAQNGLSSFFKNGEVKEYLEEE